MATRGVTATIRRPDGSPWVGGAVVFTLAPGTYTAADTYPLGSVTATAGADGAISATLWVNAEGATDTTYTCTLPSGESFTFDLPAGSGAASLSALRTGGSAPINVTTAQSLIDAINSNLDGGTPSSTYGATTPISGGTP